MENSKESMFKKPWVQSLAGIIIIILIVSGILFYKSISSYVSIENGTIQAPIISITPETSGILNEVYVKVGDNVTEGQSLARVGSEILTSKINGVIIYTSNTPGQFFTYANPVIKMIDPEELRIVGTIKENAGLTKISVSDTATFTLDAFPGNEYVGIVEEISETAKDSSVVFSISDKREIKEFTIKIKYDTSLYKEFKNSMSAKIKVYNK